MVMAKKTSRLVFEPPHELKLEIDALLLPADHKSDHSAARKILEFSTTAKCHQLRVLHPSPTDSASQRFDWY